MYVVKVIMNKFLFSSPSVREKYIYGASKPKLASQKGITEWIKFMKGKDIERICVLLDDSELDSFSQDLLKEYEDHFGSNNVLHAPIPDFHLADKALLQTKIYPFLMNSKKHKSKVVVHCAGGIGRTGHVLAGWLMLEYEMSFNEAIRTMKNGGRDPLEAIEHREENFETLQFILNL